MNKPPIKTCTFDNPATMQRECWQNKRLLYAYSSELFLLPGQGIPPEHLFFGANIGEWDTGQMIGDEDAIGEW